MNNSTKRSICQPHKLRSPDIVQQHAREFFFVTALDPFWYLGEEGWVTAKIKASHDPFQRRLWIEGVQVISPVADGP